MEWLSGFNTMVEEENYYVNYSPTGQQMIVSKVRREIVNEDM